MKDLAGAVVDAVVPFAAQPPFRLYAGSGRDPFHVPSAEAMVAAQRKGGDSEYTFLVPGKVRPVLVLSDHADRAIGEVIALRLMRFSKLTEAEQEEVRRQGEPNLFHLQPERFELPEENAAIVGSLVRVPVASLAGSPRGRLDHNALRVLHERVVRAYDLDIENLHWDFLARLRRAQARRDETP